MGVGISVRVIYFYFVLGAVIRFLDVTSGKMVGEAVHVALEVVEIALSQGGMSADRKLFMIDANRDLYITPVLVNDKRP